MGSTAAGRPLATRARRRRGRRSGDRRPRRAQGRDETPDPAVTQTPVPKATIPLRTGDFHQTEVPWATRISESGEYIHTSMEQASCPGRRNCSHGCVRSPEAAAKWFMYWSYRGDVVDIRGTTRPLHPFNGWGYHQLSWSKWIAGGALKTPVTTG